MACCSWRGSEGGAGGRCRDAGVALVPIVPQISDTSLRCTSLSPSMYRCVVWIDRWPANSCTSRNEPPALCTSRAALVTKVRRPEWDEQPFRPTFLNARLNQITMLCDVMAPPHSEATTYSDCG